MGVQNPDMSQWCRMAPFALMPSPESPADDAKPVVLGEVGEVLDVQRCRRKVVGEAAGDNPAGVLCSQTTAAHAICRDLASRAGDIVAVGNVGLAPSDATSVSRTILRAVTPARTAALRSGPRESPRGRRRRTRRPDRDQQPIAPRLCPRTAHPLSTES